MRPERPNESKSMHWMTPTEWSEVTGRDRGELHAAWKAGTIQRRGWSMGESSRLGPGSQIMQYEYDVTDFPTD